MIFHLGQQRANRVFAVCVAGRPRAVAALRKGVGFVDEKAAAERVGHRTLDRRGSRTDILALELQPVLLDEDRAV